MGYIGAGVMSQDYVYLFTRVSLTTETVPLLIARTFDISITLTLVSVSEIAEGQYHMALCANGIQGLLCASPAQ